MNPLLKKIFTIINYPLGGVDALFLKFGLSHFLILLLLLRIAEVRSG